MIEKKWCEEVMAKRKKEKEKAVSDWKLASELMEYYWRNLFECNDKLPGELKLVKMVEFADKARGLCIPSCGNCSVITFFKCDFKYRVKKDGSYEAVEYPEIYLGKCPEELTLKFAVDLEKKQVFLASSIEGFVGGDRIYLPDHTNYPKVILVAEAIIKNLIVNYHDTRTLMKEVKKAAS